MQKSTVKATKRKAKRGLNPATIEQEQSTIEQSTIKLNPDALPEELSSWIVGKKQKNIYQIESPEKGTGFNAIAWRDQDGSKLYLENLDPLGTVDPGLKVTLYPKVPSLGKMSGWPNSLPDTIFVKCGGKSAGGPNSRMAAKKMVLRLLDSYQSSFQLPNEPILKETKTDLPVGGGFAIEFSIKGIIQIEPIMRLETFMQEYMHVSNSLAYTLKAPLMIYQEKLKAGVVNGFRVEEVALTRGGKEASTMVKEIEDAAQILLSTVNTEIDNKKQTKLTETDLAALETLQKQVKSAIKDGFRNELDTRRWLQWLTRTPKPRTEDEIVPGTGTKIGEGIQGPVFKYELDPALRRRPIVLKYDNNGLNDDATAAGIPEVNPQQSVRAVAAFKISEQLELGVIPQTEFFVGTDDNGRPKLGQAMEVVNGAIGQRTAGFKNQVLSDSDQKNIQDEEDIVKNPGNRSPNVLKNAIRTLSSYVKVKGKWYKAQIFPVDIDYGNPVVQKGLSDLQVFDYIIGHADRNAGNWIYEKDNNGRIIGVKGIDNDDTFGEKWLPANPDAKFPSERGSKTPGIPPIVDISTALSILKANSADIVDLLAGLSGQEITTAGQRFKQVRQEVEQRVREGKIASMGDVGDQAKLEELRKLTNMPAQPGILSWGDEVAKVHTEQNSYLGFQLARKNQVGVVPESGDVGLV